MIIYYSWYNPMRMSVEITVRSTFALIVFTFRRQPKAMASTRVEHD